MNTDGFRIDFQSTPRLWMATRESYDGAPDNHCPYGLGKTPAEALAHLLEAELDAESATSTLADDAKHLVSDGDSRLP